jgi:hypothetical protein
MLFDLLARDSQWISAKKELESAVQSGARSPFDAADELLQLARKRLH